MSKGFLSFFFFYVCSVVFGVYCEFCSERGEKLLPFEFGLWLFDLVGVNCEVMN